MVFRKLFSIIFKSLSGIINQYGCLFSKIIRILHLGVSKSKISCVISLNFKIPDIKTYMVCNNVSDMFGVFLILNKI